MVVLFVVVIEIDFNKKYFYLCVVCCVLCVVCCVKGQGY